MINGYFNLYYGYIIIGIFKCIQDENEDAIKKLFELEENYKKIIDGLFKGFNKTHEIHHTCYMGNK